MRTCRPIHVIVHWPDEDTSERFEVVRLSADSLTAKLLPGTDIVGLEPGVEVEFVRGGDGVWHEDADQIPVSITLA